MATAQENYRDLADSGRPDGHYTRGELQRSFDAPPDDPGLPLPRAAIQAQPAQPEGSTPATAMPEFWICLFLVALLVWWCVDRFVIAARRRR